MSGFLLGDRSQDWVPAGMPHASAARARRMRGHDRLTQAEADNARNGCCELAASPVHAALLWLHMLSLTRSNVQIVGGVGVQWTTLERSSLSMLCVTITA